MSEMIKRGAKAAQETARNMGSYFDNFVAAEVARAVIEAMSELPEAPGPRYEAGEYSRRNQLAMVNDALGRSLHFTVQPTISPENPPAYIKIK